VSSLNQISGEPLMELNKLTVARIMVGMGLIFAAAGIAFVVQPGRFARLLGSETALAIAMGVVFAVVGMFVVWMARSVMAERLLVTTEGVYHVKGHGPSQQQHVVAEAPWSRITKLELVVKRESAAGGRTSMSYTLVFERRDDKPLRYLVGIPSRKKLQQIRALCEERAIPARV
jgi:hypothetical protein